MINHDDPDIDIFEKKSIEYHYYLLGDRPIRIKYIAPFVATKAEILNSVTKEFYIDNTYLDLTETSMDIIRISEEDFISACLKKGAKPPEK
jgi:hypothetical protein